MVGVVTLWERANVNRMVILMVRIKWTQSAAHIQLIHYRIHNCFLALLVKHGKWQAYSINLVWADSIVILVNHIIQTACVFIPEALVEWILYEWSKLSVAVIIIAKLSLQHIHGAQCVVPKCIYLDRLAMARCSNPVTDTHIHPCHLVESASGVNEPVRVHIYGKISAFFVGGDDIL